MVDEFVVFNGILPSTTVRIFVCWLWLSRLLVTRFRAVIELHWAI